MTPPADHHAAALSGDRDEYETLSGLLHAYRTPVGILLFGILVSLVLFFATLVGQTRDREREFRSHAVSRIMELDAAIATLDLELRQLTEVLHSGLAPDAALRIFDSADLPAHIPVVRDMGIVRAGQLTGALDPVIGAQVNLAVSAMVARAETTDTATILPIMDARGGNSRFAIVQPLRIPSGGYAYVVSDFDAILASPAGPGDPLWAIVQIADRAPAHALTSASELRLGPARGEIDIDSALDSAPFLVRWQATPPFSDVRAALLPRRSFLMQTDPLPWVVLASALFATMAIGAISLKDARRADEVRREVARKTAELRRSNAIIAAKNAELDRFASHASHDLQAPLRAMKGISSILVERQLDLDERSRDMLERINRGADRAQRLVQDLLTYTRADRQEARIELIEPRGLIAELEEILGAVITEARADLTWRLETPIHGDRFLLGRTLQNLIANAVKYRRGDNPTVEIHARRVGDYTLISVTDNGIGIDPVYFGRIFEVFERLHGGDIYEGTGIGLALCKRAAELHGGDISVKSAPGEGSCFTLRLPASLANQLDGDDGDAGAPPRVVSNDR